MLLSKHVARFAFKPSRVNIILGVKYAIRPCGIDFGFSVQKGVSKWMPPGIPRGAAEVGSFKPGAIRRSEEHTSELQSHSDLVCRLLLEKKKKKKQRTKN